MNAVLEALRRRGDTIALRGPGAQSLTGAQVLAAAARLAGELRCRGTGRAALVLDNGPSWVVADAACLMAGVTLVPLPTFFTRGQADHALAAAAVDTLLFDPARPPRDDLVVKTVIDGIAIAALDAPAGNADGVARITFTSGTTGTPKGVCLSALQLERVARSLADRVAGVGLERHLVVLPLAVLLENVAGVHAGLLAGAEIVFPDAGETGLSGSSAFDPVPLLTAIERLRPGSFILLPQMLKLVVRALRDSGRRLDGLHFIAVGGARTAPSLIHEARALGLPVYEGYGLSECGSVVSLNTPDQDRPGSVGRVLPHVQICVSSENEILVLGPEPVRYAQDGAGGREWFATGDL
ncbi:MAG: AMP-binding protein, partial [Gammaproteobacteria bacterium]